MDKDINLVEILKNAPKGTELWSPLCGECSLHGVDMSSDVPICVEVKDDENNSNCKLFFAADGKYFSRFASAECLLFPSKQNRDWSTFSALRCHKHFEPFQKVLIVNKRAFEQAIWVVSLYSFYREGVHYTLSGVAFSDDEIIPYESNEDKLGKPIE